MPPPVISVEINSVKADRQIKSIRKSITDLKGAVNTLGKSVKRVDSSKMGSRKVVGDVNALNRAMRKTSGTTTKLRNGLNKVSKAGDKTAKSIKGTKARVTELSKSIQIALGPLSGVAARLTAFSGLATGAGVAVAALVASVIALALLAMMAAIAFILNEDSTWEGPVAVAAAAIAVVGAIFVIIEITFESDERPPSVRAAINVFCSPSYMTADSRFWIIRYTFYIGLTFVAAVVSIAVTPP